MCNHYRKDISDPNECNTDIFKAKLLKLIADFNTPSSEITYS